jgi:hypothetical protein
LLKKGQSFLNIDLRKFVYRKVLSRYIALLISLFALLLIITNSVNVNASPFQEEFKSPPLKVVVSLDHEHTHDIKSLDKVAVSYEDSDGYKQIKYYDFDKMMKRDPTDPVKVKAKFPRDTVAYYEDYLICVTNLSNNQKNCSGDSRSPSTDKERIHVKIP